MKTGIIGVRQNFFMSILMLVMGLGFATKTFAKEQILATIERTDKPEKMQLALSLNDVSDLSGLVITIGDEKIYVRTSEVDEKSKVLYKESGQNVLSLKARNFSIYSGGIIELTYMKEYNIVGSNDYRKVVLNLERNGDLWSLKKEGRTVRKMRLNIYKWGISSIDLL